MDPNRRDDHLFTPLHLAARSGHINKMAFLLSINARSVEIDCINETNNDGDTPADLAKQKGHDAILKLIVKPHFS